MACNRLREYSDDRDGAIGLARFEYHLANCPECRSQIDKIDTMEREFSSMAQGGELRQPTWNHATRNLLTAYATKKHRARRRNHFALRLVLATAAAVAIGVAASVYLSEHKDLSIPGDEIHIASRLFTSNGNIHGRSFEGLGELMQPPDNGRLLLNVGDDTIGLDRNSQLKINKLAGDETRIFLVRGKVACRVKKRRPGSRFVVETMGHKVVVKGTRFSVQANQAGLAVTVVEGAVEVTGDNGKALPVRTGETLRIVEDQKPVLSEIEKEDTHSVKRLLSESVKWEMPCEGQTDCADGNTDDDPCENQTDCTDGETEDSSSLESTDSVVAVPETRVPNRSKAKSTRTVAHWRKMILDGNLREAERGLVTHLESKKQDAEAWWLRATCRRKSGNWKPAVAAYRKVIEQGSPARANNARFRSAIICQDQLGSHKNAIALLRKYVASSSKSDPLRAEAMIRLAESLLETGQKNESARILKKTTEQYGQTPASDRARRLLKRVQ